ncbi:MAG: 50S ribosomal protein L21 [Omnitrophica bacterium]|nr:50S ribosomal protein L21 [Candidatus Omnitrophota bacterium]
MYAIVAASGRQLVLEKNGEVLVNRISGKEAGIVKFKNVLFAREKNSYHVGTPFIKDAYVTCEILSHTRGKKVIAFKYKRRKSKKWKVGHRQDLTRLKVKEIKV